MKRALLLCLASGLLAVGNGCCLVRALFCGPVPAYGPAVADCAAPCDPGMDGMPCEGCEAADPCVGACDAACYDPCCRPCVLWAPVRLVAALFRCAGCGCAGSCGEVYWGDWISDPPDYCDPCDGMGGWTGGGCSSCGEEATVVAPADEDYVSQSAPRIIASAEQVATARPLRPRSAETAVPAPRRATRQCSRKECSQLR